MNSYRVVVVVLFLVLIKTCIYCQTKINNCKVKLNNENIIDLSSLKTKL
jgi:hypothetical protein